MAKKKQPKREFFESTFVVTVLTEGAPVPAHVDLEHLQTILAHGDASGGWERTKTKPLTRKKFVAAVKAAPDGFTAAAWGLDANGDDAPAKTLDKGSAQ